MASSSVRDGLLRKKSRVKQPSRLDEVSFSDSETEFEPRPKTQYQYCKPVAKTDRRNKFISRASTFEEYFPHLIQKIQATEKDKKKMPHLLYWIRYGEYKPEPVFGPPLTTKEEWHLATDRISRKEVREVLVKTKKEVSNGTQSTIHSFFDTKKRKRIK